MVSLDSPEKNRDFAESVGAGFVLLSDPGKRGAKAFGVLGVGGFFARRWTFYIDSTGVIRYIDKNVKTSTHGEDIVRKLAELGFARR
jgi:peroxiredoxin Q/BCP